MRGLLYIYERVPCPVSPHPREMKDPSAGRLCAQLQRKEDGGRMQVIASRHAPMPWISERWHSPSDQRAGTKLWND